MSRPQFKQRNNNSRYAQGQQQGIPPVVNGGLIDFQDNSNRGVPSGATGVSQEFPATAQLNQVQHYVQSPQYQNATPFGGPGMVMAAPCPPGVAMPAALQGSACFSGPPTFLHVNGVTYKPVEGHDSPVPQASPAALQPSVVSGDTISSSRTTPVAAAPPPATPSNTQVLSRDEFNKMVDDRVMTKVENYMESVGTLSRHSHHSAPRAVSPSPAEDRGSSSRHTRSYSRHDPDYDDDMAQRSAQPRSVKPPVDTSDRDAELYAARRVQGANASMTRYVSMPVGGRSRDRNAMDW